MFMVSAEEVALSVQGDSFGEKNAIATEASKIEEAKHNSICFLSNLKYEAFLYKTNASIVLVNKDFHPKQEVKATLIKVESAYLGFAKVLENFFNPYRNLEGIESNDVSKTAVIEENVFIGKNVVLDEGSVVRKGSKVLANSYIGKGSIIGENSLIYPGVNVYHNIHIGNNCIIHSGAVIGSDGFGHAPMPNGEYYKIPQVGNVIIEDNVEIGANSTIDRATMGSTIIRQGTKLDNLVQVAHNVVLGKNIVIASQAGIAGSSKIGDNCMIGGQAGVAGHIQIAKGSQLAGQSGFSKDVVEEGKKYFGSPAMPLLDFFKSFAVFKKLPQLEKRLKTLEKNNHE